MKEFIVTWEVEYYGVDEDEVTFPEDIINASPAKYYTKEWIEAEDLDSLTVAELKETASELGLSYSGLKKAELITAITEARS